MHKYSHHQNHVHVYFDNNACKIVRECGQEIPQSQTTYKSMASCEMATQQSCDNRKINKAKQPKAPLINLEILCLTAKGRKLYFPDCPFSSVPKSIFLCRLRSMVDT